MDSQANQKSIVSKIFPIGILMGFSMALPAYITSTFLSQFVNPRSVGVIYTISSVFAIIIFALTPYILKKIGNLKLTLFVIIAAFISLIGLAFIKSSIITPILFVFYFLYVAIIVFNLDIFVEHSSENALTGGIRGAYLAFINSSWIISQVFVAFIIGDSDYWKIFLAAAVILVPMAILIIKRFGDFKDPPYEEINYRAAWAGLLGDKNLFGIFSANFMLHFFYSWMVIYTPIYLHEYIGFDWKQIALIFSVMLIPFVVTEYPLGKLADKKLGEKELLIVGFLIMIITSGIMSFINAKSLLIWMTILFISRIGASTVEAMSEIYFFKKTNESDAGYLSIFRTSKAWAYIIGPLGATGLLFFTEIRFMFLALALIMILGVFASSMIKDTN